jgi:glycosyltransferase involved in cell wall biosynthesis
LRHSRRLRYKARVDTPLPLSVAIITLNEEDNLPRCLESLRGLAAEILIVDSGSTDRTAEIARQFHARFEVHPWRDHIAQKNVALNLCTQPWTLSLDADEALTPELSTAIRRQFESGEPSVDGFLLNRRTFYLGDWLWHVWYPEWRIRLVRRTAAQWRGRDPHDRLEVTGATARLDGDLLHYSYRDLADHFRKMLRYSHTLAEAYDREGRRFRWYDLVVTPWLEFPRYLILKQAWRDGWRGWIIAFMHMVNIFAKYAFLFEAQRINRQNSSAP